jgi:hypothetical protein
VRSIDIPRWSSDCQHFALEDLVGRARPDRRAKWTDITGQSGIYVVRWLRSETPSFFAVSGRNPIPRNLKRLLVGKLDRVICGSPTDILYIGKAKNLRKRVRRLARFGASRDKSHVGGEWIWHIRDIGSAEILVLPCPEGCQVGYENSCIERFMSEHRDLPLANRVGPRGDQRWWPATRAGTPVARTLVRFCQGHPKSPRLRDQGHGHTRSEDQA